MGATTTTRTVFEHKSFPKTEYYTDFRGHRQSRTRYESRSVPRTITERKTCGSCGGSGSRRCTSCGGLGRK